MCDKHSKTGDPAVGSTRLVSQDRRLRTKTLAAMLVKEGMVPPEAVEDPEGYDNWRTWDAINAIACEITKAANAADEP
jgi:hypothetical protein